MQHGEFGFLTLGLVLLAAAVLSVPIARRLGLSAIVAYLVAGIVIGPSARRKASSRYPSWAW
jgi:glutathione-regulated potassium-efflux system ancillary protein KefC